MNPIIVPAMAALLVLIVDGMSRPASEEDGFHRHAALSGIRLGSIALASLAVVLVGVAGPPGGLSRSPIAVDAFGALGIAYVAVAGIFVLSLSLTHFGMSRSRPAAPLALLLLSWTGSMAAIVADHWVVLLVALELAWLPMIALVAIDSRRLSSSESSLKAFFAHVFATLVFAHGVAFLFGATGRLDLASLSTPLVAVGTSSSTLLGADAALYGVGASLVIIGLIARSVVAPFHTWAPDVHEGAPSFVAAHVSTITYATTFLVLLRVIHALPAVDPSSGEPLEFARRIPELLAFLGGIGLVVGHAMALVQVGLRRLVGWLGVGQAGFFAVALVEGRADGGEALVLALVASGVAITGIMATLSSLSHHERACEQIGDLEGMMQRSPIRGALLGLFFLSLAGMPGTIGFIARFEILSALEHGGRRFLLFVGIAATVFAITAIGRPLLAMLRTVEEEGAGSRALTNEQFVLGLCGLIVVYFGVAGLVGDPQIAAIAADWIESAVGSLRS